MNNYILLADIGNTTIKLGLANETGIAFSISLPTKSLYTADSLGLTLLQFLSLQHIKKVKTISLCSVVPELGKIFYQACQKYLHLKFFPLIFPFLWAINTQTRRK
jgi:type III pantothenate kinase